MAWDPRYAVFTCSLIVDNLLAYIVANQTEALIWAGGTDIKPLQMTLKNLSRDTPMYPAIIFNDDNSAADVTQDVAQGAYKFAFDVFVAGSDPDTVLSQSRVYERALLSMIRNCPDTDLIAGTGLLANTTVLETIETAFDPMAKDKKETQFLQIFQIRPGYLIFANQYEG